MGVGWMVFEILVFSYVDSEQSLLAVPDYSSLHFF